MPEYLRPHHARDQLPRDASGCRDKSAGNAHEGPLPDDGGLEQPPALAVVLRREHGPVAARGDLVEVRERHQPSARRGVVEEVTAVVLRVAGHRLLAADVDELRPAVDRAPALAAIGRLRKHLVSLLRAVAVPDVEDGLAVREQCDLRLAVGRAGP